MKTTVYLATLTIILGTTSIQAELLIGWDGGTTANSATNVNGISGNLFAGSIYALDATAGSIDGTFGSSFVGADTAATAYAVRLFSPGDNDTVGVQIFNQTGSEIQLDSLVFDFGRWFEASPQDVIVTYAYGDLADANGTAITTIAGIAITGKLADYTDLSVSLSGLTDTILADGQKATFNLIASNATGEYNNSAFDNVGVVGNVIPEPATLGLIAFIGAGLFGIRRIMM